MTNTYTKRRLRDAHIKWIDSDSYTHAVTLNTDRELSLAKLNRIFSAFCRIFDRRVHGIRNMRQFPAGLRLRAIVVPENLATNAHLHGCADFTAALKALGSEERLKEMVRTSWLRATRDAGSVHLTTSPDKGWGAYYTKHSDGTYFLAADYHPL